MAESTLKEKTSKGLFWGGTSSLVKQLLNAGFGVYLARTLAPSDYGLIGMVAIFSLLAGLFMDGGLGAALINAKEIKHEDYNAVFWFNVIMSWICAISMFLGAHAIADYFHHEELVGISRCYALGFVLSGLGPAHSAYLSKQLRIKELSIIGIASVFFSGLVGVFLAWKGYAYWALMIQALVQCFINNICLLFVSGWHPTLNINLRPVWSMLRFTVKLIISNIVGIVGANFITVLLGRHYPAERVGQYTQAGKWNGMGASVLSGMVGSVNHPVLASVVDDRERQLRVFRKIMRFTAFVSFPAMFGLAFVAPEFITIALTDKWAESVPLLQILCIGGAFSPLLANCSGLMISRGKSGIFMWSNIFMSAALIATVFSCHPYGITAMVVGITVVNVLWLFVWHFFVRREIAYGVIALFADIVPFMGVAVVSILGAWFATRFISNQVLLFTAKILITAVIYIIIMRITASVTFKESLQFIKEHLHIS